MRKTTTQRYRCTYRPLTIDGFPVASESGVEPFIEVDARNAEEAARLAYAAKRCPITDAVRIEDAPKRTARPARSPRPVIQLMTGAALLAAAQAIVARGAA